jgi:serine/threonine protein kinase
MNRNHERITNEANALKLVSQTTTIPVPRLLDYGCYPDGRRYLTTEYIDGARLDTVAKRGCSKSELYKHTNDTPCKECSDEAYSNALEFIASTVMPQLATMKSRTRGIEGFVMPPLWLSPDLDPPWVGKKCWKTLPRALPDYIFQHGDIAPQNIIMDPQTLKVRALVDWEYAGYFPPGMEGPVKLRPDPHSHGGDLAVRIGQYIAEDYLECYEEWSNKAELQELIRCRKLPHPDELKPGDTK